MRRSKTKDSVKAEPEPEPQPELFSLSQTARRLGISLTSVRRLVASRGIRAVRLGNRVLVSAGEIARLVREGV